jgi:hypothetical protein
LSPTHTCVVVAAVAAPDLDALWRFVARVYLICPVAAVAALVVVASWLAAVLVLPSYYFAAVVDPAVLGPVPAASRSSLVVAVLQSCRVAGVGGPAVPSPAAVVQVLRACLASAVPAWPVSLVSLAWPSLLANPACLVLRLPENRFRAAQQAQLFE